MYSGIIAPHCTASRSREEEDAPLQPSFPEGSAFFFAPFFLGEGFSLSFGGRPIPRPIFPPLGLSRPC